MTVMSNYRNKASVILRNRKLCFHSENGQCVTDDFSCQPVSTSRYLHQKDTFH